MSEGSFGSVLFVCLGNICRSPIAEGVFREGLRARGVETLVVVDSAGTSGFHAGSPPDVRSREVCDRHGIPIANQRSRQVRADDFSRFDLIVAMDSTNERDLISMAGGKGKVRRLLEFSSTDLLDVPDPYYGGVGGFDTVFDLVSEAIEGLFEHFRFE